MKPEGVDLVPNFTLNSSHAEKKKKQGPLHEKALPWKIHLLPRDSPSLELTNSSHHLSPFT